MSRPGWGGRKAQRALSLVLARHGWTCWLCGHPIERGSASLDHVLPARTHPEQEWNPDNWRPAHLAGAGKPRGCDVDRCRCPGNSGRGDRPWTAPPSRQW